MSVFAAVSGYACGDAYLAAAGEAGGVFNTLICSQWEFSIVFTDWVMKMNSTARTVYLAINNFKPVTGYCVKLP